MAIAGFVCSFFCGLIGLIFSILGRSACKRSGGTIGGEGLALAGIIISIVNLVFTLFVFAVIWIPTFRNYTKRSKGIEAELELMKIKFSVEQYMMENNGFPHASAPLTPATPCCRSPGGQCNDPHAWQTPQWRLFEFSMAEPHHFQYAYESDSTTFTARAVGDVDCDGSTVTYEIRGTLDAAGRPRFSEPRQIDR